MARDFDQTPYQLIGEADGVRRLVDRFYDIMDVHEFAEGIRAMHPSDLQSSRDKLWMFLSGWLGGPGLYVEKFGHPKLRFRHLPFKIGVRERDEWMVCMTQALDETVENEELRTYLEVSFWRIADHMRNQEESDE